METTTTPFDLNRAIQEWRESLDQSPAIRRENLDELETHLSDSIANLMQRGLMADEAFIIATRRVGNNTVLGREFGKINAPGIWLNRALWMLVGVQAFGCIGSLLHAVTLAATVGCRPLGNMPSMYTGSLFAIVHLSTFALALVAGWRLLWRKGNSVTAWLHKVPGSLPRTIALIGACLAILLLPPIIHAGSNVLIFRFATPTGANSFYLGMNYGTATASLMESVALIVLTLLLARRQLLAKT